MEKHETKQPETKQHENQYLKKKRLERKKTFFTRKNTYRLIFMSLLMCGAFVLWAEQTGFEGESALTMVLAFSILFLSIVALAAVGVALLVLMRKLRRSPPSSFLMNESAAPAKKTNDMKCDDNTGS